MTPASDAELEHGNYAEGAVFERARLLEFGQILAALHDCVLSGMSERHESNRG